MLEVPSAVPSHCQSLMPVIIASHDVLFGPVPAAVRPMEAGQSNRQPFQLSSLPFLEFCLDT